MHPPRRRRHHPHLLREGGRAAARARRERGRCASRTAADTTSLDRSAALFGRACAVMPGGVNSPVRASAPSAATPRFIARGGRRARVRRGRAPLHRLRRLVGADDPRPRASAPSSTAITRQAQQRHGVRRADRRSRVEHRRTRSSRLVPSIEMVRLVNSGTEATMAALRLARGVDRASADHQVRGLLPRPRRQLPRQGGIGRRDLRHARQPRRHGGDGARHADRPLQRLASGARGSSPRTRDEIAAVIVEPVVGNMGVVAPRPGFLRGAPRRCARRKARCSSSTK